MLKVALSGPQGTGKTFIVESVANLLRELGYSVGVVPSPTRRLKNAGYPINNEGEDEIWVTQVVCGALRDFQESELMGGNVDVLLSDRWLLDEYVYTRYFLDKYQTENLGQVARLLANLVFQRMSRWDRVFYKMPHPDYLPEADGHRDPELEFQASITEIFRGCPSALLGEELPLDRGEAVESLFKYITTELKEHSGNPR